jgi:transposase-like protein
MSEKKGITLKQEMAIAALLSCGSIEKSAKRCDISSRQLYRWLKMPEFANAYREARGQVFGQAVSRLQNITIKAVNVLEKVLDGKARQTTKVSAARCVLENARRGQELDDIAAQLNNLERKIDDAEKTNRRPIRPL